MTKKSLLAITIALFTTSMMAETTMCFKSNWNDPSTVETTIMSGGKCADLNSIEQMKKNGWSVDDIKISSGKEGMNFMYILKKGGMVALSDSDLENRLNKLQDKREIAKKEADVKEASLNGEKVYVKRCQSCHGEKGNIEAYNTSKKISTMSIEEIKIAFREYSNNQKDNGMGLIMKPYTSLVFGNDLDAVAKYIQTLK